jgi:hypothetical protein
MEVLTIIVVIIAFLSSFVTNAIVQRRLLSAGNGSFRTMILSGVVGGLVGFAVIGGYLIIGHLLWRALQH